MSVVLASVRTPREEKIFLSQLQIIIHWLNAWDKKESLIFFLVGSATWLVITASPTQLWTFCSLTYYGGGSMSTPTNPPVNSDIKSPPRIARQKRNGHWINHWILNTHLLKKVHFSIAHPDKFKLWATLFPKQEGRSIHTWCHQNLLLKQTYRKISFPGHSRFEHVEFQQLVFQMSQICTMSVQVNFEIFTSEVWKIARQLRCPKNVFWNGSKTFKHFFQRSEWSQNCTKLHWFCSHKTKLLPVSVTQLSQNTTWKKNCLRSNPHWARANCVLAIQCGLGLSVCALNGKYVS